MKIRTRFAPSPTGPLHVGNIRTALYSWLFARSCNGHFILRIEDSDLNRSLQKYTDVIIDEMHWLHLTWDEGPYFQSSRFGRYSSIINKMLQDGKAYKCYCSKDRLLKLRAAQVDAGNKPKYDGYCRNNTIYPKCNSAYVVRFCNPQEGEVIFYDQIRGYIKFNNKELDDLIICRSDGTPTYNFCVVVDDIDMNITHVIRGEDHINNTPRQINIIKALGGFIPIYVHLPMIVNICGEKISKRLQEFTITQCRELGFLPEAILNYLVRLGWSHGNQEVFSLDQMQQLFSLENISKSSSVFDIRKLLWFNHYYINNMSIDYIISHLLYYMRRAMIDINNGPKLVDVVKLLVHRCNTLQEIVCISRCFYQDIIDFDISAAKKYLHLESLLPLSVMQDKLFNLSLWSVLNIKYSIKQVQHELNIKLSKLGMPLRVALTGLDYSPDLTSIIYLIGKDRVLKRISNALYYIKLNYG